MKRILAAGSLVALSLTLAATFILHSVHASNDAQMKPQQIEVRIDNFAFTPGTLNVPVNSTVTWLNQDDVPHVIASDKGIFKSKALDTDQGFSNTFSKAGTYTYYCPIHPKMVGRIIVH